MAGFYQPAYIYYIVWACWYIKESLFSISKSSLQQQRKSFPLLLRNPIYRPEIDELQADADSSSIS